MPAPVPPIAADALLILLLDVGLLLGLALVLGRLATRIGLPAVVGELAVGVLLGPTLLPHVLPDLASWLMPPDPAHLHRLDAIGQLGALLLVALTGMSIDTALVRRRAGTALTVSAGGLLVPLGLGILAGLYVPATFFGDVDRGVFALFLGVALCVSALPVIAKTLHDLRMTHRTVGQLTLVAGTVDDIAGWLMLSVVAAMASAATPPGGAAMSVLYLVLIVAFAAIVAPRLVRAAYRRTERSADPAATTALTVVLVFLGAAGTQAAGFEAVLGAFLAGIVIGAAGGIAPGRLAPLRLLVMSVLAPLFFAGAGLRVDLTLLARPQVLLVAVIVLALAILGKFAGAYLGARLCGLSRWEGIALGAGLNARGVIEIIVAMVGLRLGVLNTASYTVVVLIAIATSAMAPPILRWADRHIERTDEEEDRRTAPKAYGH